MEKPVTVKLEEVEVQFLKAVLLESECARRRGVNEEWVQVPGLSALEAERLFQKLLDAEKRAQNAAL